MKEPTRPILRYHGGKWELAQWIISFFPNHHIYVEPYGGAASILLQKDRSYSEIYNDLDGEIVNLFRVLRDNPHELEAAVLATPFSRDEYISAFSSCESPVESARRTLVRSHMGHAGAATHGRMSGFRAMSANSNTHPAAQWRSFPSGLSQAIERWRGVVIENRPATEIIKSQDERRTLFYCDPPYVKSSRDAGDDYRFEMTDAQHEYLFECLSNIEGMAIVSGYHTPLYDRLYGKWHTQHREATAESGAKRVEVLWINESAFRAADNFKLFSRPTSNPQQESKSCQ